MASQEQNSGAVPPNVPSLDPPAFSTSLVSRIVRARLPKKPTSSLWDISITDGTISDIQEHKSKVHTQGSLDAQGGLLTPSFCHAHIHLDKCFLLHDEKYEDLEIINGDFAEAMKITGEAKQRFEEEDLLKRGRRLIEESVSAGVTAMRAFVEVDEIVGLKCLEAGLKLKEQYRNVCFVQICAFAQLALFSGVDGGVERRRLIQEAVRRPGVDVVGSTPYVEDSVVKMKENIKWAIETALNMAKQLDFHLDYNLDSSIEPTVWSVLEELKIQQWSQKALAPRICLGHCTRLSMLAQNEWKRLKDTIGNDLPVAFVGLPTSDIFMMGRPDDTASGGGQRVRGTLQIPQMIKDYELDCAISINNVGNAFTPYGSCDPLKLASFGVGVFQAGTKHDGQILFEAISSRAMRAIGYQSTDLDILKGDPANLVLFQSSAKDGRPPTVLSLVHQGGEQSRRLPIHQGKKIEII